MEKHIHDVIVYYKLEDFNGVRYACSGCPKEFNTNEACSYLERLYGIKDGVEYFRGLRAIKERITIDRKKSKKK